MEPGEVLGEALEEGPRCDGAAAVLAGVAHIRQIALDHPLILPAQGHPPVLLPGQGGGGLKAAVPAVVAGHNPGGHIAQHGPDGPGEGGRVHQTGALLLPGRPGEAVGQDQAALGVGVEDLDGLAGEGADHIPRHGALPGDPVLTGGDYSHSIYPGPRRRQGPQGAGRGCRAGHVPLDALHGVPGFKGVAAGVHGDALAHQAQDLAALRRAHVAQHHQRRGMAAAVPHGQQAAQALLRQLLPGEDPRLDRQAGHHVRQGLGKLHGGQQIGGAVHQIPGLHDGAGQLQGRGEVLLPPALAAGVAGELRLPAAGQGKLLLVASAADPLQGGAQAGQAQLPRRGEVKKAAPALQLQSGFDRLAVDLLAGQRRPRLLPPAHGDEGGTLRLELIAGREIGALPGAGLRLDGFAIVDFHFNSSFRRMDPARDA